MPPKMPPKIKVPPGYEHSGRAEGGSERNSGTVVPVSKLSSLPPPARTEGARGRGGGITSLDYRLTQGENEKAPFEHVRNSIGALSCGLVI